ncbi:hypothetical protein BJ684DRAFT_19169 [Piptocephalis cylindrospora]|uniref:N-acetylgalactosaminide beta-1,3-galactosyltransferase n=1 Tax=Piptocephalis cylindrospora TaxID=1907219 RepID=A0A4P9Y809_9FUNG|nr:hypothetical protein BJ684DRAFT_19169 [Piptocephalis cylindrospora]|eukprot:RKP14431.1 hypothetical protein BJ684DRAFT_19169 [Piptocephalis cylindrospora]
MTIPLSPNQKELLTADTEDDTVEGFFRSEKRRCQTRPVLFGLPTAKASARVAIFVLTSPLTLTDRGQAVADTWAATAADLGVDVYFTSHTDTFPDLGVLSIPVEDTDYDHIYQKVYAAFSWLGARLDDRGYDWVMKADDDTYVDVVRLLDFLKTQDPQVLHHIGKAEYSHVGPMCWGGPGYIMSRALLSRLVPHLDACSRGEDGVYLGAEDVSITACLATHISDYTGCRRARPWRFPEDTSWEDFPSIDGTDTEWLELGQEIRYVDRSNQLPWSFEETISVHKVLPRNMYRLHAWRQRRSLQG